jgi:hypothetical protein
MVNGEPDEGSFRTVVAELLARARVNGRRVRAFGEMVAVLWARGAQDATLRLEHLWCELCRVETALLCAYPRDGFTQDPQESIEQIRATHSMMLSGTPAP